MVTQTQTRFVHGYAALVCAVMAAGCSSSSQRVIVTSKETLQPRAVNCEFELILRPPAGDYKEIGVLPYSETGRTWHEYKSHIRESVCKVGGDIVVTSLDQRGHIIRGLVLRRSE